MLFRSDLLDSAMDSGLYDAGEDFLYRLRQDQAWILFQTDREMLAQRICDEGIEKYESADGEKPFDSSIYFGFLMQKASILVWGEVWEKVLVTLDKAQQITDYFVPINRAIRIDVYRARALHGLGRVEESLEILDSVLYEENGDEIEDEDIADAFELRGKIHLANGREVGRKDIEYVISYRKQQGENEDVEDLNKLLL